MSHFKMASPRLHAVRVILAGLVFGSILHAQTTLNLASGSGAPASDVSLNLSLSGSPLPAAVQFNLGFNPSVLTYQAASVGPAASTKAVTCSGSNGAQTCVIFGVNTDTMSNGVIATLRFRIQPTTATSGAIAVSNTIASTPSGATINIGSSNGTIGINQPVVNRAPTATNASVTTTEDIAAQPITLAGTDPDGDSLTFSIVTQPAKGTLTGSGAARSYKPNANANGSDSFTFRVSDGKGGADDGLISINITPVNDPPTTQNQSMSTQQNTPKAITLTGSDIDGNTLSYSIVSGVSHGSLTGSGSNRTYTPANNYSGPDSFTFQVNDGNGGTANGTVSITVTATPNNPPTATNSSVTTNEDTPRQITLSGTDPNGDTLSFSLLTQPAKGSLSGNGANWTYTPNPNANGSDAFTFRAADGKGGADDGAISINITPVNDPPATQNQSVSTAQNTAKPITLTGSDVDGNTLSYSIVSGVSHGSLTGSGSNRTYTPANGYSGPDSFTFQVNDGNGGTANGTVSITVQASQNGAPAATDSAVTTTEDTPKQITLSGTDPNGDTLSFSLLTQPAKGSLSGNGANWTYTPKANANGPDSFTFRASDGKGGTDDGAIGISITAVNDPPTAQNQSMSTAQNTQKQIALAGSDVDGDPLTYTIMSAPAHGTLNGSGANRTYMPANGYSGPDSFTYRVSDGKLNANGAVSITVQAGQNKPPTATDTSVSTNQDTKKNITLGGTDPDGDTLAFSITGGPSHGALSGTAPNIVYTPASGYSGSDSFTFKVDDNKGGSDSGVVSINVVGSDSDTPSLTSLNCFGNSIEGGGSKNCEVSIDKRAPSGGVRVNLSDSSKQLSVPDSVRIGSRANSATFKVRSSLIKVEETVQLTASLAGGAAQAARSTVSTKIQLIPLKPKDVSCSPLQIRAGSSSTCRVTLNSSSFSEGTSLAISANSNDVKVPANIALRSGRSSVSFRLATRDSSKQQSVNVSVGMNGAQANSTVSILSSKAPLISVNNPRVVWAGKRFSMAVTAVDPNDLPVNLSAKGVPSVADFDARSGRFDWTPTKAQAGTHSVTFTAINSADASSEKVVEIEVIDGTLKVLGFTNSASSSAAAPCSPGSLATLWGAGFSEGPLESAGTFPLPVSLNNVRVTINAIEAKLLYVGASQINLQCPDLPAGESLSIAVEKLDTGDTATWSAPEVLMRAASPAIFSLDGSGAGQGLVLNAETSSLAMLSTPEIEGQA
ncbi:MAG: Ig-like domain-containing protein, partial [Bryobacterales bacterium]